MNHDDFDWTEDPEPLLRSQKASDDVWADEPSLGKPIDEARSDDNTPEAAAPLEPAREAEPLSAKPEKDDWSTDEKVSQGGPRSAPDDQRAGGSTESSSSDPRFDVFKKAVPLGIGTCSKWPGKKALMVGHGAGWHAHVQDILIEQIPYSLVPGIRDEEGRHVRFYQMREEGFAVRFDSPRATTIYLQVQGNNVKRLNSEQYKLALRGRF